MKIIDFGLATKYEDGVKLTDLVGKGKHPAWRVSDTNTDARS